MDLNESRYWSTLNLLTLICFENEMKKITTWILSECHKLSTKYQNKFVKIILDFVIKDFDPKICKHACEKFLLELLQKSYIFLKAYRRTQSLL